MNINLKRLKYLSENRNRSRKDFLLYRKTLVKLIQSQKEEKKKRDAFLIKWAKIKKKESEMHDQTLILFRKCTEIQEAINILKELPKE